jgi:hypothetical protein
MTTHSKNMQHPSSEASKNIKEVNEIQDGLDYGLIKLQMLLLNILLYY